MKNPCRECEMLHADKNNAKCTECSKRVEYVRWLDGHDGHDEYYQKQTEERQMVEAIEGKICVDEKCEFAGKSQPIENFYRGQNRCKKCFNRHTGELKKLRKEKRKQELADQHAQAIGLKIDSKPKIDPKPIKADPAQVQVVNGVKEPPEWLRLPLWKYPEIEAELTRMAEEQIRSIEGQAMYILRESLLAKTLTTPVFGNH